MIQMSPAEKLARMHRESLDLLRATFPTASVVEDEHVVGDGDLITSAGMPAGIDLAQLVVARRREYLLPQDNRRRA